MRTATNHTGYVVERFTPTGWHPVGFNKPPHQSRDQAKLEMIELSRSAPAIEFRVYPSTGI